MSTTYTHYTLCKQSDGLVLEGLLPAASDADAVALVQSRKLYDWDLNEHTADAIEGGDALEADVVYLYRQADDQLVWTSDSGGAAMMKDLAKRAVACKGWRWLPGMLTDHGRICGAGYLVSDDVDEVGQSFVDCTDTVDDWSGLLPDLTDPATVGCLLALVRETHGGAVAYRCRRVRLDLEAEALVAALEAPHA